MCITYKLCIIRNGIKSGVSEDRVVWSAEASLFALCTDARAFPTSNLAKQQEHDCDVHTRNSITGYDLHNKTAYICVYSVSRTGITNLIHRPERILALPGSRHIEEIKSTNSLYSIAACIYIENALIPSEWNRPGPPFIAQRELFTS